MLLVPEAAISDTHQIDLHLERVLPTLTSGDPPGLYLLPRILTEVSFSCLPFLNLGTSPPASVSLASPVLHRKKLTLLPRSEHPQEPIPSPSIPEETKTKSNPFGAAKPVDTDSALKKVEEKLAKEREHKEEIITAKSPHPPSSPTTPRHEKGRGNPKQLLRRTSANPPSPTSGTHPRVDPVTTAKAEAQEEAISAAGEAGWRKPTAPAVHVAPPEDEPGWETVPTRSKRVNGVGARH